MKVRNGFVSNSSSSSFIIAIDKNRDNKVKIVMEIDVSEYGEIIETIEQLDYYMNEQYGDNWKTKDYNNYLKENYNKSVEAIKNGRKIICGSFCSDNRNELESYLRYNGFPPNIKKYGIEVIDFDRE